jgi:flagellar biogenesis protein FliO
MRTLPLLLLAICLVAMCPIAAQSAPAAAPPAAKTIPVRDAHGNVVGSMPNPEATAPLHLAAPATKAASSAPPKQNLLSQIINTILSLALVLVLAYLGLLGLKRLTGAPTGRAPAAIGLPRLCRVLESQTLAQGCAVHVVAVGTQVLLVGQTGQQISVLRDLTADPQVQTMVQQGQGTGGGTFLATLGRLLTPAAPPAGAAIPLADYVRGQRTPSDEEAPR